MSQQPESEYFFEEVTDFGFAIANRSKTKVVLPLDTRMLGWTVLRRDEAGRLFSFGEPIRINKRDNALAVIGQRHRLDRAASVITDGLMGGRVSVQLPTQLSDSVQVFPLAYISPLRVRLMFAKHGQLDECILREEDTSNGDEYDGLVETPLIDVTPYKEPENNHWCVPVIFTLHEVDYPTQFGLRVYSFRIPHPEPFKRQIALRRSWISMILRSFGVWGWWDIYKIVEVCDPDRHSCMSRIWERDRWVQFLKERPECPNPKLVDFAARIIHSAESELKRFWSDYND